MGGAGAPSLRLLLKEDMNPVANSNLTGVPILLVTKSLAYYSTRKSQL